MRFTEVRDVIIDIKVPNGSKQALKLESVLYVSKLNVNLLSTEALSK